MKIRCSDCYEENNSDQERCSRCGRLLDDARKIQTGDQFKFQHYDAPNTVRKDAKPRKVW